MSDTIENYKDIQRQFMLGAGKSAQLSLDTLSLVAMRSRLSRVVPPHNDAATEFKLTQSSRQLNIDSRKLLVKLLIGQDGSLHDTIADAAVNALTQAGTQLHPFDFAKLENFIAQHSDQLGAEARQWLRLVRPEKKVDDEPYLDGPVTEELLAGASKSQKLTFLHDLRRSNPSRAREVMSGLITSEAAEMRLKLLMILQVNVSAEDQTFVASFLSDRAPTVKEFVANLLTRIPSTENAMRHLALLKDSFQVKTEGLLRRRKILTYVGPGDKQHADRANRIEQLLHGVQLNEFALAFGETEASIFDMAMQSQKLSELHIAVVKMAVNAGRFELLSAHRNVFDNRDDELLRSLLTENLASLPQGYREQVLRFAIRPETWSRFPNFNSFSSLGNIGGIYLPDDLARAVLASPAWAKTDDSLKPQYFNFFAPLIPRSLSSEFIAMAEHHAPRAALLHQFFQTLTPSST
jgi:Family of unknown function (DUF5691)